VAYRAPSGPGVRVDSGVTDGSVIPPFYDPLVAKLIVHRRSRTLAIEQMRRSVDAFEIRGIHTNLPFHRAILRTSAFARGDLWTTMVTDLRIAERIRGRGPWEERIAAIAAALVAADRVSMGPTFPIERSPTSKWAVAGRQSQLAGGGHAVPPRHRW